MRSTCSRRQCHVMVTYFHLRPCAGSTHSMVLYIQVPLTTVPLTTNETAVCVRVTESVTDCYRLLLLPTSSWMLNSEPVHRSDNVETLLDYKWNILSEFVHMELTSCSRLIHCVDQCSLRTSDRVSSSECYVFTSSTLQGLALLVLALDRGEQSTRVSTGL